MPEQLEPVGVAEVDPAEVELVGDAGGRVDPEELARRGLRHEQDAVLGHDPVQVEARGLEQVAADRQDRRRRGRRERAVPRQGDHDQLREARVGHVDRVAGDRDIVQQPHSGRLIRREQRPARCVVHAHVGAPDERRPDACDPDPVAAGLVRDPGGRASRRAGREHRPRPGSKIAPPDRPVQQGTDEERRAAPALDALREEPVGQVDASREVAALAGRRSADGRRDGEEREYTDQRYETRHRGSRRRDLHGASRSVLAGRRGRSASALRVPLSVAPRVRIDRIVALDERERIGRRALSSALGSAYLRLGRVLMPSYQLRVGVRDTGRSGGSRERGLRRTRTRARRSSSARSMRPGQGAVRPCSSPGKRASARRGSPPSSRDVPATPGSRSCSGARSISSARSCRTSRSSTRCVRSGSLGRSTCAAPARSCGCSRRRSRCSTERAASAPVLLVLEDLHWADTSTLDLVVFLAHNLDGRRGAAARDLPRGRALIGGAHAPARGRRPSLGLGASARARAARVRGADDAARGPRRRSAYRRR